MELTMELPNGVFVYWAVFVDDFWELATRVGGQDDCLGETDSVKARTLTNRLGGWSQESMTVQNVI